MTALLVASRGASSLEPVREEHARATSRGRPGAEPRAAARPAARRSGAVRDRSSRLGSPAGCAHQVGVSSAAGGSPPRRGAASPCPSGAPPRSQSSRRWLRNVAVGLPIAVPPSSPSGASADQPPHGAPLRSRGQGLLRRTRPEPAGRAGGTCAILLSPGDRSSLPPRAASPSASGSWRRRCASWTASTAQQGLGSGASAGHTVRRSPASPRGSWRRRCASWTGTRPRAGSGCHAGRADRRWRSRGRRGRPPPCPGRRRPAATRAYGLRLALAGAAITWAVLLSGVRGAGGGGPGDER